MFCKKIREAFNPEIFWNPIANGWYGNYTVNINGEYKGSTLLSAEQNITKEKLHSIFHRHLKAVFEVNEFIKNKNIGRHVLYKNYKFI